MTQSKQDPATVSPTSTEVIADVRIRLESKVMDESSALYGDDPLVGLDASRDRGDLVARLVRSLALMNNRTDSAVVALVGPWGSGKSTVLNAVERTLEKEGEWQTARYNPWSYSSLDSAIPGFFSELNSALPEELQEKGTRKKVGSWISSISPLGGLGSLAGVDAAGIIDGLGKLVLATRARSNFGQK